MKDYSDKTHCVWFMTKEAVFAIKWLKQPKDKEEI
jgi:hypothetical protein